MLHPDDARRAVDQGVAGVIVSNHGGRQLDGALAALDALPGDRRRRRRPDDRFSSIAASAAGPTCSRRSRWERGPCSLGRPYAFGLAVGGEQGVHDVLANLIADIDLTLGLSRLCVVRGGAAGEPRGTASR